jgi:hypothetical protein
MGKHRQQSIAGNHLSEPTAVADGSKPIQNVIPGRSPASAGGSAHLKSQISNFKISNLKSEIA